jgi:hypothetical protein
MNRLIPKISYLRNLGNSNGVVWIATTTLAAGIAWQLIDWLSKLNSPSSNYALAKLVGVAGLASVIILLHRFDCRWAIGFAGVVFLGFAGYHFANLGKPCGCLSKSGISTYSLLFSNLVLAILLFGVSLCSYSEKLRQLTIILSFAVFPLAAVTLFLAANEKNSAKHIWSLCDFYQRHHPFYFSNHQSSFDLNHGDVNIVTISKKCQHCRDFIKQNYDEFVSELVDLTDSEMIAIVKPVGATEPLTHVLPFKMNGHRELLMLPAIAKLSDGLVVECRELK